jgi:hypothetical protein
MLHHHSLHLYVEFIVYFLFHFPIHSLHELLENVLQVLNIDTLADLLFEGSVDAHDVR